jgi:hypothetical protein
MLRGGFSQPGERDPQRYFGRDATALPFDTTISRRDAFYYIKIPIRGIFTWVGG